ncbi:MAG: FKBP-type peptidyl-prolyl cis-trans isomerase FklB, partial [Bacteroidota bacterium]|nr:FKBP-type peptidyl-prolyl cis-trans isomerase FklB [Bacteroidota bacterium]
TQNNDFLTKNKEKTGVIVTPSGLQYEVITMGSGPMPTAESTVKVHYVGTLIDGTEFDSSYKRNSPAEFPVTGVIPGWTEALQLMPVGSKFRIVLPESIAYGANGAGDLIKPFSTLIFEVELLEIVK